MREHRADAAAHLRYLFDYRISPWGRYRDERSRREVAVLATDAWQGAPVPIATIARQIRVADPGAYGHESERTTADRLYKQAAAIMAHLARKPAT
jgi:hypothetical protein